MASLSDEETQLVHAETKGMASLSDEETQLVHARLAILKLEPLGPFVAHKIAAARSGEGDRVVKCAYGQNCGGGKCLYVIFGRNRRERRVDIHIPDDLVQMCTQRLCPAETACVRAGAEEQGIDTEYMPELLLDVAKTRRVGDTLIALEDGPSYESMPPEEYLTAVFRGMDGTVRRVEVSDPRPFHTCYDDDGGGGGDAAW
jgi:hypothetical protein